MSDINDQPPVNLRNPGTALVLALMLPGLGHLYQRRFLKSAIFFCGIMGLFGWGLATAEGHGVYMKSPVGVDASKKEFIGYIAQAGVGLPAWPAVLQHRRLHAADNSPSRAVREPLSAAFEGIYRENLRGDEDDIPVAGTLDLSPTQGEFGTTLSGTFDGTTEDGERVSVRVGPRVDVDPAVAATRQRAFRADVLDEDGQGIGYIAGYAQRPIWDWYAVPPGPEEERLINEQVGTRYDLAYVVMMIAGLLNFLAAYDAYEGPALGVMPRPAGG